MEKLGNLPAVRARVPPLSSSVTMPHAQLIFTTCSSRETGI